MPILAGRSSWPCIEFCSADGAPAFGVAVLPSAGLPADAVLAAASLARCASLCCASRLARYSKKAREAIALLGRFCAVTSPAPGCSNSASNAPRGSSAIAAIEPAAGPRPNRCRASAASSCGFVVMVASELSGLLRRACFGAAPDGCSHGAILARPGSTGRHAAVKANYLTDEGLIRFSRCRARLFWCAGTGNAKMTTSGFSGRNRCPG